MIERDNWYAFHSRAWQHNGCVIDTGCAGWDWSADFIGKKKVIGIDPLEERVPFGAELISGVLSLADGVCDFYGDNASASLFPQGSIRQVKTVSIFKLIETVSPISIFKMNIEGSEYPLLISVKHPIADQLVISFHDFCFPWMSRATTMMLSYLSEWYDCYSTCKEYGWYILLARNTTVGYGSN